MFSLLTLFLYSTESMEIQVQEAVGNMKLEEDMDELNDSFNSSIPVEEVTQLPKNNSNDRYLQMILQLYSLYLIIFL